MPVEISQIESGVPSKGNSVGSHVVIDMISLVADPGLDLGKQLSHIVWRPLIDPCQRTEACCFEAFHHAQIIPSSDFFEVRILWPRVERQFDHLSLHIHESLRLQQLLGVLQILDRPARTVSGVLQPVIPLHDGKMGQSPVVTARPQINLDLLQMTISWP